MKIETDRSRCEGHGLCANAAPNVYGLDDDAVVVVKISGELARALEAEAEAGARMCPVAALRMIR